MIKVLPPLVISETARFRARSFLKFGFMEARASIVCPICHRSYLLLLDEIVRPFDADCAITLEQLAVEYFHKILFADHQAGHPEEQMSMREV